jgi:hypothetical protein
MTHAAPPLPSRRTTSSSSTDGRFQSYRLQTALRWDGVGLARLGGPRRSAQFSWLAGVWLREPTILRVGSPLISLDSLVRIGTSQWVMRLEAGNFFLPALSSFRKGLTPKLPAYHPLACHVVRVAAPLLAERAPASAIPPFSWLAGLGVKAHPPGKGGADGLGRNVEECNKGCIDIPRR